MTELGVSKLNCICLDVVLVSNLIVIRRIRIIAVLSDLCEKKHDAAVVMDDNIVRITLLSIHMVSIQQLMDNNIVLLSLAFI